MPPKTDHANGRALWRTLILEDAIPTQTPPIQADLLERFCGLFGPSLIANAAPGALDPGLVRQSRLLNKLTTRRQNQAMAALLAAGHRAIALKGFATSRLYHRDPEARITGDLDLLVEPRELKAIVSTLLAQGYTATTDLPMPPWGFVSEASFVPMTSSDGLVDIDLHILPDCYPLALGLSTEAVMAGARSVRLPECSMEVPMPEHMLLIALSNATKEKLGPQSVKSLLDFGRILASEPELDWEYLYSTMAAAKLETPGAVTLAAIRHLRGETDSAPPGGPRMAARFQAAMSDLETGFADGFPFRRKLGREIFLTAEPRVTMRRLWDRLAGLARPGRGIPPGAEPDASARGH